jgi:predicted signal transduction protein with EAL and GGDEF domain
MPAWRVRAERDGPGAVRFYHDALDTELRERRALESDLAHALERDQFAVHYQPQFDIASRRMVGVEAALDSSRAAASARITS